MPSLQCRLGDKREVQAAVLLLDCVAHFSKPVPFIKNIFFNPFTEAPFISVHDWLA